MIYKGCIIDMAEEYAIVLTDQVEYFKVIKKDGLFIGKQIIFLEDDIYKERSRSLIACARYAAVFILLVLSTVLLSQLYSFNNLPSMAMAVVSLDINPSVEFEIDKNNQLINITAKNKEGALIINQDMIGKDIKDVLYLAIENAKIQKYITGQDDNIIIGVGFLDDTFSIDLDSFKKNIISKIQDNVDFQNINIIILEVNNADIEASRENNITIGKYRLCENLLINHEEITLEDIKSLKIGELMELPMKQNTNTNQYQWGNQGEEDEENSRQLNIDDNPITSGLKNQNQNGTQQSKPSTPPITQVPVEIKQPENCSDEIIEENGQNQENRGDVITEGNNQTEDNLKGLNSDNESGKGNKDKINRKRN